METTNAPKRKTEGRHRAVDVRKRKVTRKVPTMQRTKSLLLAALRVWELKNGFISERSVFNAYPDSEAE